MSYLMPTLDVAMPLIFKVRLVLGKADCAGAFGKLYPSQFLYH